jgi:hypothetical protein
MGVEDDNRSGQPGYGNNREADNDSAATYQRIGVLALLDDFIYQILSIRKLLFVIFVSSILLAPVSIVLSIYIFAHPSFDDVLNAQDNFGEALEVLLSAVIAASSIWLVIGIKQYNSIGSWSKRYNEYLKDQKETEKKIMLKYGLSDI